MSETIETPVSGGGADKGAPDGVSGAPGGGEVQGRTLGGESGGGAYPNPQTGKTPTDAGSSFMGHGGQTDMDYHGGGQAGEGDAPNAATGSDSSDGDEQGAAPPPTAERKARDVHAGGQSFEVIETSGAAEAEATGKIGTDSAYEPEQRHPGSG